MKGNVIDLMRYRSKITSRPPPRRSRTHGDRPADEDSIHIHLNDDGTHAVRLAGAYAKSHPLAIEALAELVAQLSKTVRHHLGFPK